MDTSNLTAQSFHRGAEAELLLSKVDSWNVVVKRRVSKAYRTGPLDESIRRERTLSEAFIMHEAKTAGVHVPSIIGIERESNTIVMSHVEGVVARDSLDGTSPREATTLFRLLGAQLGLLHAAGIVHGDLTTSNIIVAPHGEPFIVDFGMSKRSTAPEDRGVDLHLLQRSITTSHLKDASALVKALAIGYSETAGKTMLESSWKKAREIARRGRYFAIR